MLTTVGLEDVSTATTYDSAGRALTHVEGDVQSKSSYNAAGQLLQLESGPEASPFVAKREAQYSYDGFGRGISEAGGPLGSGADAAHQIE